MIVMKFGGSSLRDAERIEHVTAIVRAHLDQHPAIVVSALGKTTDALIDAGKRALKGTVSIEIIKDHHRQTIAGLGITVPEIENLFQEVENLLEGVSRLQELSQKTSDLLVSFGERLAARIVAAYFEKSGIPARPFDSWEIGFITDSQFGEAEILQKTYTEVAEKIGYLKENYSFTPVVTGFIARDEKGFVTTLGRGGSDLTASVLGAGLDVREIQVWKDVDGILTSDPRIVKQAQPVPLVSFEEASELAFFGAKVLHPLSIKPAMKKDIPVRVKNSYNPDHPGTIILRTSESYDGLVKAIACKRNVTLVDIASTRMLGQHGFLARVFEIFNSFGISVDMIATSEVSVSLTLDHDDDVAGITRELKKFARVVISKRKSILSLIGNVDRSSEILGTACNVLNQQGVNVQMLSSGASKVNIALVVDDSQVEACVRALHFSFFESAPLTQAGGM